MPQKRNPDAAELVRAKTGRIIGALQALLMVMKGLPLAYQKDMQEDKEGAMDALSALSLSIAAMTGMVRDMLPDATRMRAAADGGYSTATDLADWLVSALKMPFRDAHHVTGRIVARAASDGVALRCPAARTSMQAIEPRITQGGLRGPFGGQFGEKPRELRRNRPEERAPGGQPVAEGFGPGNQMIGRNIVFRHALAAVSAMVPVVRKGWGDRQFPARVGPVSRPWALLSPRSACRPAAGKARSTRRPSAAGQSCAGRARWSAVMPGDAPAVSSPASAGTVKRSRRRRPNDNRPFILDWLVE